MTDVSKQKLIEEYCSNEMGKLKRICNPIILRKCIPQMHWDDLYSVAMNTLLDSVKRYDDSKECPFEAFLAGNIKRTFYDWTRDSRRGKRCNLQRDTDGKIFRDEKNNVIVIHDVSIDSSNDNGIDLIEKLDSGYQIDEQLSDDTWFSDNVKIKQYIDRLSRIQREIVSLLSNGYVQDEISEILHISKSEYADCMVGIRAYENVKILY